jgi:hypothetical protein
MYSTAPRFEQDSHSDALARGNFDLGEHAVPEPIESWSLSDFEDIIRGAVA